MPVDKNWVKDTALDSYEQRMHDIARQLVVASD